MQNLIALDYSIIAPTCNFHQIKCEILRPGILSNNMVTAEHWLEELCISSTDTTVNDLVISVTAELAICLRIV